MPQKPAIRIAATGLFLLAVACTLFWEPIFLGKVFYCWDHTTCFLPIQVDNARQRAAGEIPLWNRYLFLGYPYTAEMQCSGIYPPALVFNLIRDPGRAYTAYVLLHYAIAALSTMFLARQLGMGLLGCTVSALVFVFGGSFSAQTFGMASMTTFSWAPLVLGLLIRALQRKSYAWAIAAGAVLAVEIVSAHPQAVVYTLALLLGACLLPGRGAEPLPTFGHRVGLLATTLLIGLALCAPQLFYTLELMQQTHRGAGLRYAEQVDFSLPPQYFFQFVVPGFLGNDRDYVEPAQYYELRAYFGLLALGLIPLGWRSGGRCTLLFRIVLVAALVLALGRFIGVYHLFSYVPVLRAFRAPTRILLVASLAAGILAGLGIDRLWRGEVDVRRVGRRFVWVYAVLGALCVAVALFAAAAAGRPSLLGMFSDVTTWLEVETPGLTSAPGRMPQRLAVFGRSAWEAAAVCLGCMVIGWGLWRTDRKHLFLLMAVVLLAVDLVAADRRDHRFKPWDYFSRSRPIVEFLRRQPELARVYRAPDQKDLENLNFLDPNPGLLLLNSAALYQVDSFNVDAAAPLKAIDYFGRLTLTLKELGQFNVKYLLTTQELPDLAQRELLRSGRWRLYENPHWQPRASVREEMIIAADADLAKIAAIINSPAFEDSRAVVLDQVPQYVAGEPAQAGPEPVVAIKQYGHTKVVLDAVLPRDGVLLLSDLYYPGWRATSNGREIPILRANGVARGLALGPGHHVVEFTYHPKSFYRGLYVAGVTVAVLLGLGTFWAGRRFATRRP